MIRAPTMRKMTCHSVGGYPRYCTDGIREPLGAKRSAKEAWEAIAAMRVGSDRAKKATAQLLKQEYINLKFKDDETVEDFFLHLQMLISKLKSHGVTIDEEEAVSKFLHSVSAKYIQIALSIETILD